MWRRRLRLVIPAALALAVLSTADSSPAAGPPLTAVQPGTPSDAGFAPSVQPSRRLLGPSASSRAFASAGSATPPPQQKYGASFSPLVGHAHTIFAATFTAPFEVTGESSWYDLEAFGPPGCAAAEDSSGAVLKGQQTKLYLRRSDMVLTAVPRAWCPGSYIANLEWWGVGGTRSVLMGNFTFHVHGKSALNMLPQDRYGVRISPRIGGPRTVFVATFPAPFDANALVDDEANATYYQIEAFGPPGCADSGDQTLRRIRKGQQVTLKLGHSDIFEPHSGVRGWCPGAYIANVIYVGRQGDQVLLGNFRFRVRSQHH